MSKICYQQKKFNVEHTIIIQQANTIIAEYEELGYSLTLRQVYYQFVRRNWFPATWQDPATGSTNNERSYKKLGSIINDARLAGLIDWDAIEDRTRNLKALAHWETPADIIDTVSKQFRVDIWKDQPRYVEVWVEKDALLGVVERACNKWDVPYFSCRGYTSQSEMWGAAMRLVNHAQDAQTTSIIHLGDHDPSGKDMTRDVIERLQMFMEHHGQDAVEVSRIALNMDQIEKYNPPPNPAKITDSRADAYIAEFGNESWELDALEPQVIEALIEAQIEEFIEDKDAFEARRELITEGRILLSKTSHQWDAVVKLVNKKKEK